MVKRDKSLFKTLTITIPMEAYELVCAERDRRQVREIGYFQISEVFAELALRLKPTAEPMQPLTIAPKKAAGPRQRKAGAA